MHIYSANNMEGWMAVKLVCSYSLIKGSLDTLQSHSILGECASFRLR